jgi:hypothetical protein
MAQVNFMTQAQYAKHRKCSRVAVHKAVKDKRISLIDGKIDPAVADIQWAANTRARAPGSSAAACAVNARAGGGGIGGAIDPDNADNPDDYWISRGRREAAEADLAELKLAEQRGNLIQIKAVESVWSNALAGMREHLLQIRARLGPLLANESDTFLVEQMLEAEHNQALQLMSTAALPGAAMAPDPATQ